MIRIFVRWDDASMAANVGGPPNSEFKSFDVEAPELEAYMNEALHAYTYRSIVGVEVLKPNATAAGDRVPCFNTGRESLNP